MHQGLRAVKLTLVKITEPKGLFGPWVRPGNF